MRELGCIIRVYTHDAQTRWDKIVGRAEKTINSTTHRSTGMRPIDLHPGIEELYIDPRLKQEENEDQRNEEEILEEKIRSVGEMLKKRAEQRKRQTDKHGEADRYQPGTKVWVKLHRRSDANRRLTRKIHLVYDGPYVVRNEVRRNTYLIKNMDGHIVGTFNSRQIRSHRETKCNQIARVNMIQTSQEIQIIDKTEMRKFIENI